MTEALPPARRTRELLAHRHRRCGQVDMTVLVRDVLTGLREVSSPGERSLLLVHVMGWLEGDVAGQLAQAVASRLSPFELLNVGRAGLLTLAEAAKDLEPTWRDAVERLLAPALAARSAQTRHFMGDVLVCAEGTRQAVGRKVVRLKGKLREPSVLIVAAKEDAALTLDEWVVLLSHEAKLSGDAQLGRFAALARHGQVKVMSEEELPAPASHLRHALERAWAWIAAVAYDEEVPAARHHAHGH